MNVSVNLVELLQVMLEKYGLAGFALLFWVWHGWQLQKKFDTLQATCNKMFGLMLALTDKRSRIRDLED